MKAVYQGIVVESSLALDPTIFHEEKPDPPTDPAADVKPKQEKPKQTARKR